MKTSDPDPRMTRPSLPAGLVLLGLLASPTVAQDDPEPAARLQAARDAIRRTGDASEAARTRPHAERDPAEVRRTFAAFVKAIDAGVALAAERIRAEPGTAIGLAACDLLLSREFNTPEAVLAIEAVTRHHAADPNIAGIVARTAYYNLFPPLPSYQAVGTLLDAVEKANTDRIVRAQVAMSRARRAALWLDIAEVARDQWAREADRPPHGTRTIKIVRAEAGPDLDPDRLRAGAIAAYRVVIRDSGDVPDLHFAVPPPKPVLLRETAASAIFELDSLRTGRPAPPVEGVDLEGKPFRLADYRGRVVMLAFWASWCGPCMAAVPRERELAERYAGRPFAFVGVNGDEDRAHALAVQTEHRVPGRSFWNGPAGAGGPIAKAWNVSGWPTVYLIDADGVIRGKQAGETETDALIATLVAEAERPNDRAAPPTTRP